MSLTSHLQPDPSLVECSGVSDSFAMPWKLLCAWNFPGKNTGEGSHFLLQGTRSDPGIELLPLSLAVPPVPSGPVCICLFDISQHFVHRFSGLKYLKLTSAPLLYISLPAIFFISVGGWRHHGPRHHICASSAFTPASLVWPQFLRRQCGLMVIHSSTACDLNSTAPQADLGVSLSSSPYWTMVFARKTKLKSHYNEHGQDEKNVE